MSSDNGKNPVANSLVRTRCLPGGTKGRVRGFDLMDRRNGEGVVKKLISDDIWLVRHKNGDTAKYGIDELEFV